MTTQSNCWIQYICNTLPDLLPLLKRIQITIQISSAYYDKKKTAAKSIGKIKGTTTKEINV
jgi:hypothetical protein